MDKTKLGHIKSETSKNVTTITFYHPSHNSLPGKLLRDLAHQIKVAGENKDSLIVLLQSSGNRTFCAGASFDELVAIQDIHEGENFFSGFGNVINAIRKCPKLVIGRIQGKAIGGGVGLAASCDYCIATKYASVKLSELAVGIGPFVIGPAVERKIGLSAYSQLAINATEWKTAYWASHKGLYNDVFESIDDMDNFIVNFLGSLTSMNPKAMKLLKEVFWQGTDDWDRLLHKRAKISGELVLSDFAKNTIQSFLKS